MTLGVGKIKKDSTQMQDSCLSNVCNPSGGLVGHWMILIQELGRG